ncbi:MAG TPA: cupredoxin domain-containing protein [Actinomycetota bacterium]
MTARRLLVPALLTLVSVLASCSGGTSDPGECENAEPADRVQLQDFAFEPDCLVADVGASIHLENVGEAPHTFTVGGTDVDLEVEAGGSADGSLSGVEAGRYLVTCTYHPQMTATLTVGGQ